MLSLMRILPSIIPQTVYAIYVNNHCKQIDMCLHFIPIIDIDFLPSSLEHFKFRCYVLNISYIDLLYRGSIQDHLTKIYQYQDSVASARLNLLKPDYQKYNLQPNKQLYYDVLFNNVIATSQFLKDPQHGQYLEKHFNTFLIIAYRFGCFEVAELLIQYMHNKNNNEAVEIDIRRMIHYDPNRGADDYNSHIERISPFIKNEQYVEAMRLIKAMFLKFEYSCSHYYNLFNGIIYSDIPNIIGEVLSVFQKHSDSLIINAILNFLIVTNIHMPNITLYIPSQGASSSFIVDMFQEGKSYIYLPKNDHFAYTLVHESLHAVLYEVFRNEAKPYYNSASNDFSPMYNNYKNAVRGSMVNFIQYINCSITPVVKDCLTVKMCVPSDCMIILKLNYMLSLNHSPMKEKLITELYAFMRNASDNSSIQNKELMLSKYFISKGWSEDLKYVGNRILDFLLRPTHERSSEFLPHIIEFEIRPMPQDIKNCFAPGLDYLTSQILPRIYKYQENLITKMQHILREANESDVSFHYIGNQIIFENYFLDTCPALCNGEGSISIID